MERIEHAIDVNAPAKAVYERCIRFSDYPRFMEGVEAVRAADERHLHWRAVRNGEVMEWSSVITERDPERCIAWHDLDGRSRTVTLTFSSMDDGKTRVCMAVSMPEEELRAQGAAVKQQLAQRMAGDLERLKKLLENSGHDWDEWPSTHDPQASSSRSIPVSDASGAGSTSPSDNQRPASPDGLRSDSSSDAGHPELNTGPERSSRSDTPGAMVQGLLQGWDQPLSIVRKMSGEMDLLFERLIGRPMVSKWGYGMPGKWAPTVEVAQRAGEFVISVDLPGVARQDVHIEIQDDKLTIEGERREPGEQKSLPGYRRSERSYGRFYRQVPLPAGIQPEKIRATLLNGVLEVRMPLPPGMGKPGRRVDIEDLS